MPFIQDPATGPAWQAVPGYKSKTLGFIAVARSLPACPEPDATGKTVRHDGARGIQSRECSPCRCLERMRGKKYSLKIMK